MITTKLKKLDDILIDGISDGTITDIFGFRGTGKTQMALQISLNLLKDEKTVLFVDTTGEFRPERLLEILKNRNLDNSLLNRLKIARVTNTQEQIDLIQKIKNTNDVAMLIIDNVADLFSFEYSKKEQFNLQYQKFMNYMHDLAQLAINKKIPIVITNQLMNANDTEYEKMNYSISNYTHQKIKLEKQRDHYQATILSPFSQKIRFFYKIKKMGLVETS
jgi:RecA/RadA recombinase